MDSARWHRLKTLLADALERPADERHAFIEAACKDDAELLDELRRLLAHHDDEDAPLRSPVLRWRDAASDPAARAPVTPDAAGQRVGAYRLVRPLGQGGMGTVYLAERVDGQFEQQVAIKLVRNDLAQAEGLARFAVERQVLARLEHPNIARLLDGGVTDSGRPYVVMEYVPGMPITDYCTARKLTLRERLRLFQTICDTVQYAHRNLVVHRDLKPSNILVTDERGSRPDRAQVKLLDFGIAKLIEDVPGLSAPLTRTGHRLMTPEYAAPEQVRGEPVTTATDVYQLGVLLYELLVGHRPFRLAEHAPHQIERVILEETPTRPSVAARMADDTQTAAEPVDRARRLQGDLDTIMLKALRKEPDRRYTSPEHLAEDLRRHLEGLPVSARQDTFRYRTSRFIRRHRTSVVVATVVLFALVAGLGIAVWQGQAAAAERDRAQAEAQKAEAINAFLVGLFSAADPREDGREVRVVSLLDEAAASLDTTLADQPDVEAAVRQTLGVTYRELGLFDEAEDQLRRALTLREAMHGPRHREVFDAQNALGNLYILAGDYARADSLLTHAFTSAQALFAKNDPTVGTLMSTLGYARYVAGDLEGSLEMHRAALTVEEQQPAPDSVAIGAHLGNVAIVLADLNRLDEAVPLLERQVAIYREALEADNSRVGRALSNLASVYVDAGRPQAAVAAFEEAVAIFRETVGEESFEVAGALGGLGAALDALERYAEAEDVLRRSLRLYEQTFGPEHPRTGSGLLRLGGVLGRRDQPAAAEAYLRRAVQTFRAGLPGDHPALGRGLTDLGTLLHEQGRSREAVPLLREALTVREAALPSGHPDRAETASRLGAALASLDHADEAEKMLKESYESLHSTQGPDHQQTVDARERLRTFYASTGRPEQAAALAERP